jgi:hypothetical protein
MSEKKIGPKEAAHREMRETRYAQGEAQEKLKLKVKSIGKLQSIKAKRRP